MNRIDRKFKELKKRKRKVFIAYITAGDPSLKITERLIPALEAAGVDILELGVPFSDPMADGLTIQKASERALAEGTTLGNVLKLIKKVRQKTDIPIVLFTYLNPLLQYGIDKLGSDIDGVLILDLPVEESTKERKILSKAGIEMIYLLAPTSTAERIKLTCKNARGFIYYVSRTGVTGIRGSMETSVKPMVRKIKKFTKLPVAVGFGISKPEHVKEVGKYADAVVVGSAIVDKIEKKFSVPRIAKFVRQITKVL